MSPKRARQSLDTINSPYPCFIQAGRHFIICCRRPQCALRQNRDGLDDTLLAEAVGKARDNDVASRNRNGGCRQRNEPRRHRCPHRDGLASRDWLSVRENAHAVAGREYANLDRIAASYLRGENREGAVCASRSRSTPIRIRRRPRPAYRGARRAGPLDRPRRVRPSIARSSALSRRARRRASLARRRNMERRTASRRGAKRASAPRSSHRARANRT